MSKFETESSLKQTHYYYHNYYFVLVVVDVVHNLNDPYHKGQAISKYVRE